jgi:hypothetical protein
MGNTRQLPECLPYYLFHCFRVLLVPRGFQPLQYLISCPGFLIVHGEAVVLTLAGVAAVEFGILKPEVSLLQDCGTLRSWTLVTKRGKKVLVATAVIEAVLLALT